MGASRGRLEIIGWRNSVYALVKFSDGAWSHASDVPPGTHWGPENVGADDWRFNLLGIGWCEAGRAWDLRTIVFVHLAYPTALFAVAPLAWSAAFVGRRRRKRRGRLCAKCGYDLRASPDRCPECGTVPAR
jgi:hypothetical protein